MSKTKNSTLMYLKEYSDMYKSEEKLWWYIGLRDVLRSFLKRYLSKKAKILDAGCGTGKNSEMLKNLGYTAYSIDVSQDALDFCKTRGITNLSYGSVSEIPFEDESFDGVLCMDVLGILNNEDQIRAVREIKRVLKSQGIAMINCAALPWLYSQHDIVTNLQKRFYKNELEDLFKNQDFEIVKSTYRVFLLFPLVVLTKTTKKLINIFSKKAQSDQNTTPAILNPMLTIIQRLETFLIIRYNLPIGSSVFLIVKKSV